MLKYKYNKVQRRRKNECFWSVSYTHLDVYKRQAFLQEYPLGKIFYLVTVDLGKNYVHLMERSPNY